MRNPGIARPIRRSDDNESRIEELKTRISVLLDEVDDALDAGDDRRAGSHSSGDGLLAS